VIKIKENIATWVCLCFLKIFFKHVFLEAGEGWNEIEMGRIK
jgi:hypothetical protein